MTKIIIPPKSDNIPDTLTPYLESLKQSDSAASEKSFLAPILNSKKNTQRPPKRTKK